MKNRMLSYFLTLITAAFITITACIKLNAIYPSLPNFSVLPENLSSNGYVITGITQNQKTGIYILEFYGNKSQYPLALTINDMGSYIPRMEVLLNGSLIYKYDENAQFKRVHWFELDDNLMEDKLRIEIKTETWENRATGVASKKRNVPLKAILSTTDVAMKVEQSCHGFMMVLLGVAGTIVLNSIVVLQHRRRENSYFFLALLAAVRFFCMLIDTSSIPLSMNEYYHLHYVIIVLPAVLNIALGVWLYTRYEKNDNLKFSFATIILMAVSLFLQYNFDYNWYHLIQWIGLFLIVMAGYESALKNQRGWKVLCIGYAVEFSIVIFLYAISVWDVAVSGMPVVCLNVTSISYIPSLIGCMAFISLRLTDKYNESEELAIQLKEINTELDNKVFERTKELTIAQQRQKNMMLNIFHDLRNPVFILKGYVDKISDKEGPIKEIILSRLDHLQRLIDDLFLSEKLEGKEISMLKDAVELKELIEEIAADLELSEKRKIDMDLRPLIVWADETRIRQIFENLIVNAIQHTSKGSKILVKSFKRENKAVIQIIDEGNGISKEDCEHIFERYYTSENKSKKHGTGLGLYIAKMLVELHGGNLTVRSELNKGSCFTVELDDYGMENEYDTIASGRR